MTTLELMGIAHELGFWKGFVKTDRFLNGWVKKIKTPELNNQVADFIIQQSHNRETLMEILDVGSGVVSILNGMPTRITTADPLGELYKLVFDYDKHSINPPLPAPAEELGFFESFDIVHCSNALDHTQNPMKAFAAMVQACKPGGHVIIQGFVNEAVYENYKGFHQWNLRLDDDNNLVISGKVNDTHVDTVIYSSDGLNHNLVLGTTFELPQKKEWFIWIIQKI